MHCDCGSQSDVFRFLFLFVYIFSKFLEQFLQKLEFVVHNLGDGWICLHIPKNDVLFQSNCLAVSFTELHVANHLVVFIVHSYDLVSWVVDFFVVFVVASTCNVTESFRRYPFAASLRCVPHFG